MKAIAKANSLNDLEIRRIVYGLLQAGLVEVIRPEGVARPALVGAAGRKPAPPTPVDKVKSRSLINRLITRIRSL